MEVWSLEFRVSASQQSPLRLCRSTWRKGFAFPFGFFEGIYPVATTPGTDLIIQAQPQKN